MSTILHDPIQVPPKTLKMQRIDEVHIDYVGRAVSITVGSYEEKDSEFPSEISTEGFSLDEFVTDEYLTHFKFVFKSIHEIALINGMIGAGVETDV